jgi:hypothetical protein
VTAQGAQIAGSTAASDAARDWEAVRASAEVQYAPLPPIEPPKPPVWLAELGEWLRGFFEPIGKALGLSWPVLQWILIGLAALGVLFILWRLVEPLIGRPRKPRSEAEPEWAPARDEAMALLQDADRLAAEGRYGEAAHLLLKRSVRHIADARPDARLAFGAIATRVERSIFALRDLDLADWTAAREAYAQFALQELRGTEVAA